MNGIRMFALAAAAAMSAAPAHAVDMGAKFAAPDVLAVVHVDRVVAQPEEIRLTTTRVLKGRLQPSLRFSLQEWGDDLPPVGAYVLVRLKREGDRLLVMDRESHVIPATEHGPSDGASTILEKVAGELVAALQAIEATEQNQTTKAWRRSELIGDLASVGDAGSAELRRLHSMSSGSLRLAFLAGLLQAGDASSSLETDLPLLTSPPSLIDVEEEFISGRFGSSKEVTAQQAARVLTSTSPRFRTQAAYALRKLADSKTGVFDSQVLESIVRYGLMDPDWLARYYSVCALAEVTKLQPVRSTDLFQAHDKEYVDFWKTWARRGGVEAFLKTAATAPSGPIGVAGPPSMMSDGVGKSR